MSVDAFAVLAEPTRRRIVDALRRSEASVGDLVTALGMSQPAVSKHLRVLREAGVVRVRTAAQQRIYRLDPEPFRELEAWLAPYRRLWTDHLDRLERHLDSLDSLDSKERP
jgi:DNA-binding transcriptional ArsR family regulator